MLIEGRQETVDGVVQNIILSDDRGVLLSVGATLPSDGDSGYAKGCMFIVSGGTINTTMYVNDGDATTADFNTALGGTGDLTAITTDGVGLVGGGTSGAISPKLGITVKNATGGTLTKGTLVRVSGYSGGYLITKADADAGLRATYILTADILDTASGTAYAVSLVTSIDTSAGSVGDPLYLSATAGEYTVTAPSGADQIVQRVGIIVTSHATTGSALFFPSITVNEKVGTSNLQDASVTPAKTNIVEARTATADGTTTGTISANKTHITVTSDDANKIIILPAPVVGLQLTIDVGATGFELRSSTPASISINGGSGSNAESAIPANSTVFMTCVSATAWKGYFMDADGDVAKVEASA